MWYNAAMGTSIAESLGCPYEDRSQRVKQLTWGKRGTSEIRQIVLHSAECSETRTAAVSLAEWLRGKFGPRASWHYAIDSERVVCSVLPRHVAWHAGQVNPWTIGIELAGRASQSAEDWADDYSRAQQDLTVRLLASLGLAYGIPLRLLTDDEVRRQVRGVTTHRQVTAAFGVKGGHTDPGPNYPLAEVVAQASWRAAELARAGVVVTP